jgi:hypothetical protein
MIQPEDIRRKAENLYRSFLQTWLEGGEPFFPRVVPASKAPGPGNVAAAVESMRRLREVPSRRRGSATPSSGRR